jgi:hypothetical protein
LRDYEGRWISGEVAWGGSSLQFQEVPIIRRKIIALAESVTWNNGEKSLGLTPL